MGLFSQRASQSQLAILSRSLGMSLYSGIDIIRAFELAGRKTSTPLKQIIDDIISELKSGSDVTTALEAHSSFFPDLFVDMVNVGEQTGALPEVLKSLGNHYENNVRLKKEFIGQITMPVVQFVAAILIVAALIALLGWIGESTGETFDVLGLGLMGTKGALTWLGGWLMLSVGGFIAYKLFTASLDGQKMVDRLLLRIPVLGHCLRSFAIARFSWAFHLTQQAGMTIGDSLEASLRSTSNGAYIAATSDIVGNINEGESLSDALSKTDLFTTEFNETVLVAEASGTVPEALDRLSPQFEESARRSMQALATTLGWLIWAAVATFVIIIVFKVFLWYIAMLDEAMRGL